MSQEEHIEGYIVDIACLRKYPKAEMPHRAKEHTRQCSLAGHCIESGFGLVGKAGDVQLLDADATPLVIDAILSSNLQHGIRLRAKRAQDNGEMKTVRIETVE